MELAVQLPTRGKTSYGYLLRAQKKLVDEIVDELAEFPAVRDCYRKWMELQHQVESYYRDEPMREIPLSQQKEFRSVKNAIIYEAERIRMGQRSFEDDEAGLEEESEQSLPDTNLLHELWLKTQNRLFELEYRQNAMAELEVYADIGSAYAQYCMGKIYRDGGTVIPDAEIARSWLEKSVAQNFSAAQYALADLLLSNDPTVQNRAEGLCWMETVAKRGNSAAQYRLGREALEQGNKEKSVEWFSRAADHGSQYAQYMLGKLYLLDGQKEKAIEYFSMAAAQGNSYAQFFLDRQEQMHHPSAMLAATQLFRSLAKMFQDNSQKQRTPSVRMDRKRRMELMQKRAAMGIKGPIQEQEYNYSQSM